MKFILSFTILFSMSVSQASLSNVFADAIKQSSIDKQLTKVKLEVDETSVDAKWSTPVPVVVEVSSDLYTNDIDSNSFADFVPDKDGEEFDDVLEIAREFKESQSIAKEVLDEPVVNAR